MTMVDILAEIIRNVDGNHDLGAGQLAEKILEHENWCLLTEPAPAAPEGGKLREALPQISAEEEPSK